ncbi:EF-hand calcium-binding domain-containing protein 9 [Intoshia linei]|uniref:EF-hand calcium-binding domain-containing protein 9 n=1 Tax=Intoshia linei TaxID=1819745 RepID=A0A177BCH8_9BILA|nr:EF-hand calcium-binding domain-containing protein 9 [Intoshia linei]
MYQYLKNKFNRLVMQRKSNVFKIKFKHKIFEHMHLNEEYSVFDNIQSLILLEIFNQLYDCRKELEGLKTNRLEKGLNIKILNAFLQNCTNLKADYIIRIIDLLSTIEKQGNKEVEIMHFENFVFMVAILVALKDGKQKIFSFNHDKILFNLIDSDRSGSICLDEFLRFGFLLGINKNKSLESLFRKFDITGDKELEFMEFRLLIFAYMDEEDKSNEIQTNEP